MSDAAEVILQVETRSVLGKRVKQLRREGLVPGNVYGRGRESTSIQTSDTEVRRVFSAVDRNAVVPISIDGASDTIPVVLREVQRHPVSRRILHLDFYEVDLERRIHSEARLVLVGSSEAEAQGGTVVQSLEHLMLEALPTEMPSIIEVNVSGLDDFGQSVLVRDLTLPDGVESLTDEAVAVATVLAPRVAEEDEVEEEELVEGEEGEVEEEEGEVEE
ncbi:MAG: 50S ribosomal protein L25 [Chloroflexi bacterium]|nr:50S ribosomal protein L25 [Chloroflexota bacterium]MYB21963.1 50S ribosomal protein L25 [Chloroflexota bacterium]MYD17525.1 50S ribosomal protein L25 [Chloroflexota bacterium]MYF22232.1 50S ribosomal protein L25 [Chloroflexota bacterium]MYF82203.1 50S ribosomal protein L25 [Chloroflexota bacterium]